MPEAPSQLYRLLEWAKQNGDVSTLGRLRMKLLPLTVKEKIILDRVTPTTTCSPEYINALRAALTECTGKECPR